MRVLHFYKTALPDTIGGAQICIDQLATGLAALDVDVDLLTLAERGDGDEPARLRGYRLHRARRDFEIASTGFSASVLPRFRRLAAAADIVHYHFPWPFMDAAHMLLARGKPSVVTYHSDIVRQKSWLRLYAPLGHRFLSSVDRIVATSPQYRETSPVLRRHAQKVSVIPIGLDPAGLPVPTPRSLDEWRGRIGEGFFLFIGVLRYYKGLDFLIEAARQTGLPTVIVGSGPEEARLKAQAAAVPGIRFLGHLAEEDKAAVLSLCGALVLPSHLRAEAFGIALLEGALHGKPLISCEIGTGTSSVNQAGRTGLVVPPADPEKLADAMRQLRREPAEAHIMGEHARRRALEIFNAHRMAQSYLDLYRDLLASRPA
jgi:glycosyltransferase involved in cell wall biosynthesis